MDKGRLRVLDLLKREGPLSAEEMAARLAVTAMAVRQHLYALAEDGHAAHETMPAKGRGRPRKAWRATAKADAYFTDAHSALAADLIVQMKSAFGDAGVDRLLSLRTGEQHKLYAEKLADKRSLKAKLAALAKIRNAEGYMARVARDAGSGGFVFMENHCPICAAARLCQGLCREELSLFRSVLGTGVTVERTSHILAGAGRCAYRIAPAA